MNKQAISSKVVTETFQNSLTLAENAIQYYVKNGSHVVCHIKNCGEDIAPDYYRFATIEEARLQWKTLKAKIERKGMEVTRFTSR